MLRNVMQGLRGRKHQDTGESFIVRSVKDKFRGITWAGHVAYRG